MAIRFGVLCTKTDWPRWQLTCIEKLLALDAVKLELIILANTELSGRRFKRNARILLNSYASAVSRLPFLKLVEAETHLSEVAKLNCDVSIDSQGCYSFDDVSLNAIRQYRLDFILNFSGHEIADNMANISRYGNWYFNYDRCFYGGKTIPFFWEIFRGDVVTRVTLEKQTLSPGSAMVLKEGVFRTINYSYSRNLEKCLAESVNWPAQLCASALDEIVDHTIISKPSNIKGNRIPDDIQMVRFTAMIIVRALCFVFQSLFRHEKWNIGIVRQPIAAFIKPGLLQECKIEWLPELKMNKYVADPFAIEKAGKTTILCEQYDYSSRGIISYISVPSGGHDCELHPAISDLPFHMSYPYIIEYGGELYCVPETHQAVEASLYRAVVFPAKWEKAVTLIKDVSAVDSTVFKYKGLWWLFCTDENRGAHLNLFVWYSSDLFGEWRPHSGNPVKTDVRSSRPGGTPFIHEGQLYRPSQDCSTTYGARIVLNKVTLLNPTEFKEEPVCYVEPDRKGPFPVGLHTLSAAGDFTLIDGKRWTFSPAASWVFLRRVISRNW